VEASYLGFFVAGLPLLGSLMDLKLKQQPQSNNLSSKNQGLDNLVGFFEVLIRIDKRLQKEKRQKRRQRD